MAVNKSYNQNLKQFPHEVLYGTILKTVEIGPTTNQAISTFATKMKNNWAAIGIKITRTRQKFKKKAQKNFVMIKPGDKKFLSTKNLTNDKLDTPYIGTFKIINVKNTTVELFLPNTKIFPKFHVFWIKKTPPNTPLTTIWNYSPKKYEIKRILQKKKNKGNKKQNFW